MRRYLFAHVDSIRGRHFVIPRARLIAGRFGDISTSVLTKISEKKMYDAMEAVGYREDVVQDVVDCLAWFSKIANGAFFGRSPPRKLVGRGRFVRASVPTVL